MAATLTPKQISTLRKLHADRKSALNSYHACLQANAPAAERIAAENRCSLTMQALKAFTATL